MVPDLALQGKFGGTYQYLYSQDHNADWFNAIQSKGGYFQTFNGSISGGSDKMSYFSSLDIMIRIALLRILILKELLIVTV